MDKNKELKLKKILNEQLNKGVLSKKKHKKEMEFIKQLKENKK
jgi:hypothetical protein